MITISNQKFRNEEQAVRYLVNLRARYGCGEVITLDSSAGQFLFDLLKRHPSWPIRFVSLVSKFMTGRYLTRSQRGFCWVDRAGTVVPFSYRVCIKGEAPSAIDKITEAAVRAILHQHNRFLLKRRTDCDGCDEPVSRPLVGYLRPRTFQSLWGDYRLNARGDFAVEDGELSNDDTREDWQAFHQHNAVLRALCARCYYQQEENRP